MLALIRFQSQQCIIIHHTHNESLEWSRCSGLAVTVPILTNFSMRIGNTSTTISSSSTEKVSWWRCLHQLDSNLNSASSFIIPIMSLWSGPAEVVWLLRSQYSYTLVWGEEYNYSTISPSDTWKVSWWRCLHHLDSNLNSASSFIIPIMSHWSGPAAVVWPLRSQYSHPLN